MANKNSNQQNLYIEHMVTKIMIKTNAACKDCPYRIYAKDDEVVTLGVGNINSDFIFILPTYDIKAKIGYDTVLSMLALWYEQTYGKNIFDDIYITRLVKCSKNTGHDLYQSCIQPCSTFLAYELNKLGARTVVFFGSAYDDYIARADTVGHVIPKKNIFKSYSPSVLYYKKPDIIKKFYNNINSILNPDYHDII